MASRMASARHKGDGGKEEPGVTGRGSQTARSPSSPLVPSPTRPRAAPARQHQGRRVSQRSKARSPSPAAGSPPAQCAVAAHRGTQQLLQEHVCGSPSTLRSPVTVTERQARWLGVQAGTSLQCRRRGNDSARCSAAAAPARHPVPKRALHARLPPKRPQSAGPRGGRGPGARSFVDPCDEDSDDTLDAAWMGGGMSPDGPYTGSIYRYLQAQKSMQVNQKRARSACREMVCAVPHLPTAAASQRRGVKAKDERARSSASLASPLAQVAFLHADAPPEAAGAGERELAAEMEASAAADPGSADPVLAQQPDPVADDWFPEDEAAADVEEWVAVLHGSATGDVSRTVTRHRPQDEESLQSSRQMAASSTSHASSSDVADSPRKPEAALLLADEADAAAETRVSLDSDTEPAELKEAVEMFSCEDEWLHMSSLMEPRPRTRVSMGGGFKWSEEPQADSPLAGVRCEVKQFRASAGRRRHRFSKVLSVVPLYSQCTRAPTCENVRSDRPGTAGAVMSGRASQLPTSRARVLHPSTQMQLRLRTAAGERACACVWLSACVCACVRVRALCS